MGQGDETALTFTPQSRAGSSPVPDPIGGIPQAASSVLSLLVVGQAQGVADSWAVPPMKIEL